MHSSRFERLARPVDEAEAEEAEAEAEVADERRGPFKPVERPLSKAELTRRRRQFDAAMHDALRALRDIGRDYAFEETLYVCAPAPSVVEDIDDDHERELVFTKQALDAAIAACDRLDDAGTPYRRPDDYFAEMVKSDAHMAKVQERLGEERRRADARERARREREMRKFAKQAKKEHAAERMKEKTLTAEQLRAWRKKHKDALDVADDANEGDGEDDDDEGEERRQQQQPAKKRARRGEDKAARYHRAPKQRGWKRNNGHDDDGGWKRHKRDAREKALAASIPAEASVVGHGDGGHHSKPAKKHRKAAFKDRRRK